MPATASRLVTAAFCGLAAAHSPGAVQAQPVAQSGVVPGEVRVVGNRLVRDGHPWIPHGFYQVAFEVSPGALETQKPFWAIASQNYSPAEYAEMRAAGADSVRIQVSQPGMDPNNPLSTPQFRDRFKGAVGSARAAGLTVIVSIQDESQTGEQLPAILPNDVTRRIWRDLAPVFGHDRGVLFELFNEPGWKPSPIINSPRARPVPTSWQAWKEAMDQTISTVRTTGATNVVIADGLQLAEQLTGAPRLYDPLGQVAYGAHPYAHNAADQTAPVWDRKFGDFARIAPVFVTEWGTGYYCDSDTPASVVSFLQYLQEHGVGLQAGTWDWSSAHFGSAVYDFPHGKFSSFVGPNGPLSCQDAGFGLGKTVEAWYRTGVPPVAAR